MISGCSSELSLCSQRPLHTGTGSIVRELEPRNWSEGKVQVEDSEGGMALLADTAAGDQRDPGNVCDVSMFVVESPVDELTTQNGRILPR